MSVIVWKMNGDVFTKSFQNAILLKKFVKTQIVTFQIDELFSN